MFPDDNYSSKLLFYVIFAVYSLIKFNVLSILVSSLHTSWIFYVEMFTSTKGIYWL